VQRGALQALRAEATAAKVGLKEEVELKAADIIAVEAEAECAWIAAEEAASEAIRIAARIAAAEAEAEAEAGREAEAEAARIVANEAQVAEAACVPAANAEAQAARLLAEEAAEEEAACIAAEEQEAEAEAACIAAEEGSPALFTDAEWDGLSVDHTIGSSRVEITCPDDSRPGDVILVEGPDGKDVEVIVPENIAPGETFEYDLEADTVTEMNDLGPDSSSRVEITCPDGCGPGDFILIEGPDG
jgi:predicted phage tail protein